MRPSIQRRRQHDPAAVLNAFLIPSFSAFTSETLTCSRRRPFGRRRCGLLQGLMGRRAHAVRTASNPKSFWLDGMASCATQQARALLWLQPLDHQRDRLGLVRDVRRPARADVKRSQGDHGQVLSCIIPRCRSHSVEKATSSHGEWLAWEEPRAFGDLAHVEKFFARNLGSLIHARTRVPGRLGKATSRPLLSTPRGCLRKSVF
jgi:hypothetical protein